MKHQIKFLPLPFAGLVLLLLSACSTFYTDDRPESEYRRADSAEQLVIPPDLSTTYQSADFVISGVDDGKLQRNTLLPVLEDVQFLRKGDLAWLELSSTPEELWPLVRQFIEREGYLLQKDEPLQGIMQTAWAEERLAVPRPGFLGLLDKTLEIIRPTSSLTTFTFRFERESGRHTRLFVDHRTIAEERIDSDSRKEDGEFAFRDAERNPELESRMLTRLLVYLGVDVQRAKGILSAEDIVQLEADAYIAKNDNRETALFIAKTYPLAWNEVELALENLYFDVEDDDFDNGRFEVSHAGQSFAAESESREQAGFWQTLGDLFSSESDKARQYQVYLGDRQGGTYVSISDDNGEPLDAQEELAILNAIRLQLI